MYNIKRIFTKYLGPHGYKNAARLLVPKKKEDVSSTFTMAFWSTFTVGYKEEIIYISWNFG